MSTPESSAALPLDDVRPANQRRLRLGGMMRCLIGTIQESDAETEVGTVIFDKFDNRCMARVATDGVWEVILDPNTIYAWRNCADCGDSIASDHKGIVILSGDLLTGRVHAGCNSEVEVDGR